MYFRYWYRNISTHASPEGPVGWPASPLPYLQQLRGSVSEAKLPQHAELQLVADGGPLATVQGVGPLDLLRVPQLLQPADHILHHGQPGH